MKPLGAAAAGAALVTAAAVWGLRASEATLTVAGVAAAVALTGWLAAFHGTPARVGGDASAAGSGLALSSPAALVALALVGRFSWATALPVVAAQVLGAALVGAAALALGHDGTDTLVWDEPAIVTAGGLALVVGVVAAWAALAADAGPVAWLAAGPVTAGALLGAGLAAAAHPAVLVGLGIAGAITWPVAVVAAFAVLIGAALGPFLVSWVSPH